MSARGKRKEDEDHVSEGDAPPKKTFRKDSDETDEIVVCEVFHFTFLLLFLVPFMLVSIFYWFFFLTADFEEP